MCLTPFTVKKDNNELVPVPCGKCEKCRSRRASAWSFRLMNEVRVSTTAYFITLTYDTSSVPITQNGFMGLRKRDIQLFFKRLRKAHDAYYNKKVRQVADENIRPLKYYAVGEYGGKSKRPHYHIILFNAMVELIQDAWWNKELDIPLGNVHYGDVNGASVGYTLKYVSKAPWQRMHKNDDRQPEFSLMSKNLGYHISENNTGSGVESI